MIHKVHNTLASSCCNHPTDGRSARSVPEAGPKQPIGCASVGCTTTPPPPPQECTAGSLLPAVQGPCCRQCRVVARSLFPSLPPSFLPPPPAPSSSPLIFLPPLSLIPPDLLIFGTTDGKPFDAELALFSAKPMRAHRAKSPAPALDHSRKCAQ